MNVVEMLEQMSTKIIEQSLHALQRVHLSHYQGPAETRERLRILLQHVIKSIRNRNLTEIVAFARQTAEDRFACGYDIHEVQTAFNVLEEVIWKMILEILPPKELGSALGLVSTVLGAGKDELARTYVALASKRRTPSLDLNAISAGTNN